MPIILGAIVKIGRRSNTPNMGVYLVAISDGRYHVYAAKPSWILILSHCLRIYIWIGGSLGPLK